MKISDYVSQNTLTLILVILIILGIGISIGRHMATKRITQEMNRSLLRKARAGSIKAQSTLRAKKKQLSQVKEGSSMVISSILVLGLLVAVALLVSYGEKDIKKRIKKMRS